MASLQAAPAYPWKPSHISSSRQGWVFEAEETAPDRWRWRYHKPSRPFSKLLARWRRGDTADMDSAHCWWVNFFARR